MAKSRPNKDAQPKGAAPGDPTIALTPKGQLAFWKALHAPVKLTAAQRELGKVMRGEA